ncbi:hypothetical protein FKM82_010203 [Ascaphus truei]
MFCFELVCDTYLYPPMVTDCFQCIWRITQDSICNQIFCLLFSTIFLEFSGILMLVVNVILQHFFPQHLNCWAHGRLSIIYELSHT